MVASTQLTLTRMSFELCAKQGFREAGKKGKTSIAGADHES
jgi:hypothetical protein